MYERVDCSKLYLLSCKHITNTTLSKRASFFWATIWTRKWISMPNIVPYHFICKYLHFPQDRKLNPEIEKAINQVPFLGSEIIYEQKKLASASFFLFNFMKFFRARAANCVFNKIGPIRISLTIYSRLIKKKKKSFFIMTCMPDFG